MRNRADFVRCARGLTDRRKGFVLQARRREGEGPARVGFTCSKKVGNAVARNRAKRRLREIARMEIPQHGAEGWDYVLIGRREATAERDFAALSADLVDALRALHR